MFYVCFIKIEKHQIRLKAIDLYRYAVVGFKFNVSLEHTWKALLISLRF